MAQSDKQDTVIHAEADNAAEGTVADSKAEPNDAEENMRALMAQYEARIDEVADLIARVRHEINNPLAGVLGQAQLLLREELSEKARKRAETIEQMASRVRDIVAQLRQVQRISRG